VREATARSVLGRFAAQVGNGDGGRSVKTGIDRAAMELTHSVWCGPLQSALIREFQARNEEDSLWAGSVSSLVGTAVLPEDGRAWQSWIRDQVTQLRSVNQDEALLAALLVMRVAYENKINDNYKLLHEDVGADAAAALIGLISRSAVAARAASWAL